ncbi:diphthine synthase [Puccinia triticina 1-1 BBBD Race 1]|uniref:diphthine methyl ester synthase n=1 Tax=Puccinia triticina (isolate 1-1 / race 1 (BBBD)) TaxID=630390 RepID=A0A0C4ENR0_PUCT1|nr:diphthine synthase [Puccinia triticina 1-1 BBBD Race 1]
MFYLIGIGMSSPEDITLSGLKTIKDSKKVYLEGYTSVLIDSQVEDLQALYGTDIILADRDFIETRSDEILDEAAAEDVSLLVVGDPFGATTHADLLLRCTKKGIKYRVIHNVSILNAIGSIGINLYHFGQTVSIPFFNANWRPQSWFKKINQNFSIGLHTLCLLDIKVKEQSDENLARGRKIYEKPRYMTITTAIEQILSIMEELKQADESLTGEEEEEQTEEKYINRLTDPDQILCIAACRVTSKTEKFLVGTMSELAKLEPEQFGGPLHSLIILGDGLSRKNLNPVEIEFLSGFAVDKQSWLQLTTPSSD